MVRIEFAVRLGNTGDCRSRSSATAGASWATMALPSPVQTAGIRPPMSEASRVGWVPS